MSASKHVTIWCDFKGQHLPYDAYPSCHWHIECGGDSVVTAARRSAREAGWRRIDGKDACPPCAAHLAKKESTDV